MNQFIKTFIISILIVFGIKSTYAVFNTDTVIEVDRKNEIGLSGHLRFYRNMKPSGVNSMFYFRHPLSSHAYVGAGLYRFNSFDNKSALSLGLLYRKLLYLSSSCPFWEIETKVDYSNRRFKPSFTIDEMKFNLWGSTARIGLGYIYKIPGKNLSFEGCLSGSLSYYRYVDLDIYAGSEYNFYTVNYGYRGDMYFTMGVIYYLNH